MRWQMGIWLGLVAWIGCGNDEAPPPNGASTAGAGGGSGGSTSSTSTGGAADDVAPTAYLVFPVAVGPNLPSGTAFPVIAAGDDDREVALIEVLVDGEVVASGAGVPTLWRSDTSSATDAGAISQESLTGDGYFEFTMPATRTQKVIGVGGPDMDAGLDDIELGFYFTPNGNLTGALGAGTYASGDVLRFEVAGGTWRSFKNGIELKTGASTRATWFLDTWLAAPGAALSDAKIAMGNQPPTPISWANLTGVTEALAVTELWDSTAVSDGAHTFSARVTDTSANVSESTPIMRTVDNTLPLCTLDAPAPNSVVSGTVQVSGTATDANLATLAFFVDAQLLSQHDNQAQASTTWDTSTAANGVHTLRAVAYDHAFQMSAPCEITVTVGN